MELMNNEFSISIRDLSICYSEFKRNVRNPLGKFESVVGLSGINLDIPHGQNTAIIGNNGAGKSTLIKAISGHLRPSSGSIEVDGKVITLAGVNPGFQPFCSSSWNVKNLGIAYGIRRSEIEDFSAEVHSLNKEKKSKKSKKK